MPIQRAWFALILLLCIGCDPRGLTVTLVTPEDRTYTHGTVPVRVEVTGQPEQVELLVDGTVVATLSTPYTYDWDTRSLAEGPHVLTARARSWRAEVLSLGHQVIVDRTPPQLVQRTPAPGEPNVSVQARLEARFSEAMRPDSFTPDTVRLEQDGSAVGSIQLLAEEGTVLRVLPSGLTAPGTVRLSLGTGITDLAGNELVQLGEAWVWNLPVLVRKSAPADTALRAPLALALDASGAPVVAWSQYSAKELRLFRWNGEDWEAVAQPASGSAPYPPALEASLQLDSTDQPVLAWSESWGTAHSGFDSASHVRRWTGSAWEELGDTTSLTSVVSALQLDATGAPVLPWAGSAIVSGTEQTAQHLHVRRWEEGAWRTLGEPVPYLSTLSAPALRSGRNGSLAVAFVDQPVRDGAYRLRVLRWTGAAWEPVGEVVREGSMLPRSVSLDLDATGLPVVAWTEEDTGLHLRHFEEGAWKELASVAGVWKVSELRLQARGTPVMAVVKREGTADSVHVLRWKDSTWSDLTGPLPSPSNSQNEAPVLRLDSQDAPVVAWFRTWQDPETQQSDTRSVLYVPNR